MAEGDYVIVHGRFSGRGSSVNWIAADILRIENGVFQEHWDVLQDEATEEHYSLHCRRYRDFNRTTAEGLPRIMSGRYLFSNF